MIVASVRGTTCGNHAIYSISQAITRQLHTVLGNISGFLNLITTLYILHINRSEYPFIIETSMVLWFVFQWPIFRWVTLRYFVSTKMLIWSSESQIVFCVNSPCVLTINQTEIYIIYWGLVIRSFFGILIAAVIPYQWWDDGPPIWILVTASRAEKLNTWKLKGKNI